MSYKLTLEHKRVFLHATVTGRNSRKNVTGYLEEIGRECAARSCLRVLIEERLEGPRLGTMDVFEIAGSCGLGTLQAIAYVDLNADGDLMAFAETVARNRGTPVRLFRTVSDAEKWLRETR